MDSNSLELQNISDRINKKIDAFVKSNNLFQFTIPVLDMDDLYDSLLHKDFTFTENKPSVWFAPGATVDLNPYNISFWLSHGISEAADSCKIELSNEKIDELCAKALGHDFQALFGFPLFGRVGYFEGADNDGDGIYFDAPYNRLHMFFNNIDADLEFGQLLELI